MSRPTPAIERRLCVRVNRQTVVQLVLALVVLTTATASAEERYCRAAAVGVARPDGSEEERRRGAEAAAMVGALAALMELRDGAQVERAADALRTRSFATLGNGWQVSSEVYLHGLTVVHQRHTLERPGTAPLSQIVIIDGMLAWPVLSASDIADLRRDLETQRVKVGPAEWRDWTVELAALAPCADLVPARKR